MSDGLNNALRRAYVTASLIRVVAESVAEQEAKKRDDEARSALKKRPTRRRGAQKRSRP